MGSISAFCCFEGGSVSRRGRLVGGAFLASGGSFSRRLYALDGSEFPGIGLLLGAFVLWHVVRGIGYGGFGGREGAVRPWCRMRSLGRGRLVGVGHFHSFHGSRQLGLCGGIIFAGRDAMFPVIFPCLGGSGIR